MVKLFKTKRQKYPSPVEPSPTRRRALETSETRAPQPTSFRLAWVSAWKPTHTGVVPGWISQMMHEDGEREKTEIRIRPSGGLTVSIQIRLLGGLYLLLYPDLTGRRGVKLLARREFSIPSGLWGVLAAGGREFSDVAGGPAVRRADFFFRR